MPNVIARTRKRAMHDARADAISGPSGPCGTDCVTQWSLNSPMHVRRYSREHPALYLATTAPLSLAHRLSLPPITPLSSNIDVDAVRVLRGPPTTLSRLLYHPILNTFLQRLPFRTLQQLPYHTILHSSYHSCSPLPTAPLICFIVVIRDSAPASQGIGLTQSGESDLYPSLTIPEDLLPLATLTLRSARSWSAADLLDNEISEVQNRTSVHKVSKRGTFSEMRRG